MLICNANFLKCSQYVLCLILCISFIIIFFINLVLIAHFKCLNSYLCFQ